MENDKLNILKSNLQKQIENLKLSYEKIQEEIEKVGLLYKTVKEFIDTYNKTNDYNFNLFDNIDLESLDKVVQTYDYTIQSVDYYKSLLEIKKELEKNNFGDRTKDIDDKLNQLMAKLKLFLSQYLKTYKAQILKKEKIKDELKNKEENTRLVEKILNEELVTNKDLSELEKLNIEKEDLLTINLFVVKNNLKLMKDKIADIQRQQVKERIESKIKERNETKEAEKKLSKENVEELESKQEEQQQEKIVETQNSQTISKHDLTNQEQELIEMVKQQIRAKNVNLKNKDFLQTLIGLSPENILDFVDNYQNPEQKILIILNNVIIPKIENGEIHNAKEILQLYLNKYNQLLDRKTIPNRLASVDKQYMQQLIEKAQGMLEAYKSNNEGLENLIGYYSSLNECLNDLLIIIEDDELFESTMLEEIYKEVEKSVFTIENLTKKVPSISPDLSLTEDFYEGANNFLIFPGEIDFSEQVDNDDALDGHSKKKILNGLKQLSADEDLFTSSRHKVKDSDSKYQKLRRYKGMDYRIVYRTSRAAGLERIFGKKMNVAFLINTGYGATSEKEKLYKKSKNIYDSVYDEIEKTIAILNSDNDEEIKKIVNKQMYKMQNFINSCDLEFDNSSSRGAMGGNNNE